MKNKFLLFSTFVLVSLLTQAQYQNYYIYSGPGTFKSFDYSSHVAGQGWDSLSYDDSAWPAAYNGSGRQNGSTQCAGPNQSAWGDNDTIIWSSPTTLAPDTACFRRILSLPKCGVVKVGTLSLAADDTYFFYINGNFFASNPTVGSGVNYTLTPTQLSWFHTGDNILAIEVVNSAPSCGEFDMIGTISIDTTGCLHTDVSPITANSITVSPNPATNQIQVTVADHQSYSITVYDMIGNIVLSQNTTGINTNIDISNLSKGVYSLELVDVNGHTSNKRIVKE